ncbi:MAG: CRISPR-associated endonuclease Cas1, partial [Epulopiscium sp. Nele67-Bin001]
MRKLLNTIFILNEEVYLTVENENLVAMIGSKVADRKPLHNIETIICFSHKGASPYLMGACASRQIGLVFLTPYGRFLARVQGETQGNVYLRKTQYKVSEDEMASLEISKSFMLGKFYNSRSVLTRVKRDHSLQVDENKLQTVTGYIKNCLNDINEVNNLDSLRGLEGSVARMYFSVFDELILQNKEEFFFRERSKRPPMDRVNALLSFFYTLLTNDCANALESVGLDSYIGFMHQDRPGRKSLALDIMEELRAHMVDRFVVTLINKRIIRPNHFIETETGAIRFT